MLSPFIKPEKGGICLGQTMKFLERGQEIGGLEKWRQKGVKYCLLGVPESVGVLANHGRKGTENAWMTFLKGFINLKDNRFLSGQEVLLLGSVDVSELQLRAEGMDEKDPYYLQKMHMLCSELDELVGQVVQNIVQAGLTPIIIGGGQNNALPVLQAFATSLGRKRGIHVLNVDVQADFSGLNGRHHKNSFFYARDKGYLHKYFAFGLHQDYTSELTLKALESSKNVRFKFLEEITYLDKSLVEAVGYLKDGHVPCGLELDLSSMRMLPSSNFTPSGFSLEQMRHIVRKAASSLKVGYLHLSEAAPQNEYEQLMVGKALCYLVTDFIKANKLQDR